MFGLIRKNRYTDGDVPPFTQIELRELKKKNAYPETSKLVIYREIIRYLSSAYSNQFCGKDPKLLACST